jgi:hypothetical protein
MALEFQLDHQDHKKVEDFIARSAAGVSAISLHPKVAAAQRGVAETARDAGLEVLYDPRTERLEHEGFTLQGIPGYTGTPYNLDALAANVDQRQQLIDAVLGATPDVVTIVTPPHFLARDARTSHLDLALAEATRLSTDKRVRPVLMMKARFPVADAAELAREYAAAGFDEIELRFTPLGGEDDGIPKIRAAFTIADLFRSAGLKVILGRSGNVGQTAYALGHVDGYSMGIGQMEHVNHSADITRQKQPPKLDEEGNKVKSGGAWQGVYIPNLATTLSMKRARTLLGHTDVRTKLLCRIDHCANSLLGPVTDYRSHYLHSRAAEAERLAATPPAWRGKIETDRLQRALELRELVNTKYRAAGEPELKVRTLQSLVDGIEEERAAVA